NPVRADNRLDDQCGNRLWSFQLQNFFRACEHVFSRVPTSLNAVIVIRNAKHSGNAWLSSPATRIARECQRARRAAVICTITRADLVSSGVKSCDTDRILVRLRAAVREEERVDIAGRQLCKLHTQARADFSRHERVRVQEHVSLFFDRLNHALVAVTDVDAHELAVEIDEAFTFGRPKINALRARNRNRIDSSLGGPFEESVATTEFNDLLACHCFGSGCHNVWMLGQDFRIFKITGYSSAYEQRK